MGQFWLPIDNEPQKSVETLPYLKLSNFNYADNNFAISIKYSSNCYKLTFTNQGKSELSNDIVKLISEFGFILETEWDKLFEEYKFFCLTTFDVIEFLSNLLNSLRELLDV